MMFLDQMCREKQVLLKKQCRWREIDTYKSYGGPWVEKDGDRLLSFCSNDYFGLSQHSRIMNAAKEVTFHVGNGASRLVSGSSELYEKVERQLAYMKQVEGGCLFGSGYLANVGVIPVLVGKGDLVITDRLVHACVLDGVRLSGAEHKRFKHNDLESLKKILSEHRSQYRYCLVITETVFSMDGDIAPINEIVRLVKQHNAWSMTDDAHGFGIVQFDEKPDVQMGTLSKVVGTYGGYVCASQVVIDYVKSSARSLMFTTALPDMLLSATLQSLMLIVEDENLKEYVLMLSGRFCTNMGIEPTLTPIVPYPIGANEKAMSVQQRLGEAGYLIKAIRPPTVPDNTARLRITFSALHTVDMVDKLANDLRLIVGEGV